MEYWEKLIEYYESNPVWTIAMATAGLILVLVLLTKMASRKPRRIKAFADNAGSVYVSIHAITDLIRATCEHIEGISKTKIKLRQKRGATLLELRLRMISGSRIHEIRKSLQEHLKDTLETNLGIENLGNITVIIDEYRVGPAEAATIIAPRTKPAPDPFPVEKPEEENDKTWPPSAKEIEDEEDQPGNEDDRKTPEEDPDHPAREHR